jgi:hypothetical protein
VGRERYTLINQTAYTSQNIMKKAEEIEIDGEKYKLLKPRIELSFTGSAFMEVWHKLPDGTYEKIGTITKENEENSLPLEKKRALLKETIDAIFGNDEFEKFDAILGTEKHFRKKNSLPKGVKSIKLLRRNDNGIINIGMTLIQENGTYSLRLDTNNIVISARAIPAMPDGEGFSLSKKLSSLEARKIIQQILELIEE